MGKIKNQVEQMRTCHKCGKEQPITEFWGTSRHRKEKQKCGNR